MALSERVPGPEEIIAKIGRCAVEPKLDGFRCQIHKDGERIEIFSRNLERTTPMFPDLVEAVKRQVRAREIIFEGEALAFDEGTGELLPFQTTIQRKRKHGVEDYAKEFPLKLFAFDLLYVDGEDWTRRREAGPVRHRGRPSCGLRSRVRQLQDCQPDRDRLLRRGMGAVAGAAR